MHFNHRRRDESSWHILGSYWYRDTFGCEEKALQDTCVHFPNISCASVNPSWQVLLCLQLFSQLVLDRVANLLLKGLDIDMFWLRKAQEEHDVRDTLVDVSEVENAAQEASILLREGILASAAYNITDREMSDRK